MPYKAHRVHNLSDGIQSVPVVQWIEYRIPVPTIRVRLPTGIQLRQLTVIDGGWLPELCLSVDVSLNVEIVEVGMYGSGANVGCPLRFHSGVTRHICEDIQQKSFHGDVGAAI